ncbi:UBX domain-containing protein 6 [Larimichthys crocea]|uniref:Uncharacterized protein n=1 Tax=Larimichthys crocea TaxID=215358 RepID=A0ACD3RL66_LARCR|nr:UBX domain-containing protein 6 [Larimichthys crocea]
MLRTKAMREKEEQRERRKYNYTLLRIRLPDGSLLQGTFYAWDRLPVLFEFVRESLVNGWQPFELIAPGSQKLQESEEVALAECNLVPAALLTFAWDCRCAGRHRSSRWKELLPPQTRAARNHSDPELS